MISRSLSRYAHWLHLQWPAGTVEPLPRVAEDGSCSVPHVYVVGDLTGVPLLKFAIDSGARAVKTIARQINHGQSRSGNANDDRILDLLILGGGVAGMAAALEAVSAKLKVAVVEAARPFATLHDMPARKPIFTYPSDFEPESQLKVSAEVKEDLLVELDSQLSRAEIPVWSDRALGVGWNGTCVQVTTASNRTLEARYVIVALGRSGEYRSLGVPGEDGENVSRRLFDPNDFHGMAVVVVGGGDSALETSAALAEAGARVTLVHRGTSFSRAKPENVGRVEALSASGVGIPVLFDTVVESISSEGVSVKQQGDSGSTLLECDRVFLMIGREIARDFFHRSRVPLRGELGPKGWAGAASFVLFCVLLYVWKAGAFPEGWYHPWPKDARAYLEAVTPFQADIADRRTVIGTLAVSMKSPSFYYTIIYSLCVVLFGVQRIRRRRTPYITAQTITLAAIQVVPLFLLPELVLPWLGYNGYFDHGFMRRAADHLFELYIDPNDYLEHIWPEWGHPRAYWRAYGFILAWPLMVYNVFTDSPHIWWLVISAVQTFLIIPVLILFYGKGAYCGWICSCGALAETVGDQYRERMPHGATWNRLNLAGQVLLGLAFALLFIRILGWLYPHSLVATGFPILLEGTQNGRFINPLSWKWTVDILLAGILGVGLYFHFSGRVWCRFFCPLAALMHIYARFSRFRIFADKKRCISCNVCTSVCHQGIDVMSFANKGLPMNDPQCVRCSACVQSCPTGVLSFGRYGGRGEIHSDRLSASLVQIREGRQLHESS